MSVVSREIEAQVRKIGSADVVVGIPSYNNSRTIARVVEAMASGLKKYFPELKSVIINSDGASIDSTTYKFMNSHTPKGITKLAINYNGPSGKGSALKTVFEIAKLLGAHICVVTDADSRSITPEWANQLVSPVYYHNFGFVTPLYLRDKHDATITNSLVYPMTTALYGLRIRQPIGGDFAFSNGFLQVLNQEIYWDMFTDIYKFGVDIWMTTTAICEGFRICQTALGTKIHDQKSPGIDLASMFKQVVGTLFELFRYYPHKWKIVKYSREVEIFGDYQFTEVEDVHINPEDLCKIFSEAQSEKFDLWERVLSPDIFKEVNRLAACSFEDFELPTDLWAKLVYDFASFYAFNKEFDSALVLESMVPLYLGRVASSVKEMSLISDELADCFVQGTANTFERLKSHLLKRWEILSEKTRGNDKGS
jgi:glycosyltransferase involved in cell wall biosynthesis